jgi:hypothetical protein
MNSIKILNPEQVASKYERKHPYVISTPTPVIASTTTAPAPISITTTDQSSPPLYEFEEQVVYELPARYFANHSQDHHLHQDDHRHYEENEELPPIPYEIEHVIKPHVKNLTRVTSVPNVLKIDANNIKNVNPQNNDADIDYYERDNNNNNNNNHDYDGKLIIVRTTYKLFECEIIFCFYFLRLTTTNRCDSRRLTDSKWRKTR